MKFLESLGFPRRCPEESRRRPWMPWSFPSSTNIPARMRCSGTPFATGSGARSQEETDQFLPAFPPNSTPTRFIRDAETRSIDRFFIRLGIRRQILQGTRPPLTAREIDPGLGLERAGCAPGPGRKCAPNMKCRQRKRRHEVCRDCFFFFSRFQTATRDAATALEEMTGSKTRHGLASGQPNCPMSIWWCYPGGFSYGDYLALRRHGQPILGDEGP